MLGHLLVLISISTWFCSRNGKVTKKEEKQEPGNSHHEAEIKTMVKVIDCCLFFPLANRIHQQCDRRWWSV
jgi:hypothetical protein